MAAIDLSTHLSLSIFKKNFNNSNIILYQKKSDLCVQTQQNISFGNLFVQLGRKDSDLLKLCYLNNFPLHQTPL